MSANIFISFAAQDRKVASTLCSALEGRGFECWISARDIQPGENFQVAIVRAIRKCKIMLLVFTANSNRSEEMTKELALASQYKLIVVPLRIEDVAPSDAFAYEFATRQWIDFFSDWEFAIQQLSVRLTSALAGELEAERKVEAAAAAASAAELAEAEEDVVAQAPVAPPKPAVEAPAPAPSPPPPPAAEEPAHRPVVHVSGLDADAARPAAPAQPPKAETKPEPPRPPAKDKAPAAAPPPAAAAPVKPPKPAPPARPTQVAPEAEAATARKGGRTVIVAAVVAAVVIIAALAFVVPSMLGGKSDASGTAAVASSTKPAAAAVTPTPAPPVVPAAPAAPAVADATVLGPDGLPIDPNAVAAEAPVKPVVRPRKRPVAAAPKHTASDVPY